MAVETHAYTDCILRIAPIRRTCIRTGIGIYTGLQALAVNVIDKRTKTVRETCRMNQEFAIFVATAEEAVIDVYMVIAAILKTELNHSIGLSLYYRIIDLETIGIP